MPRGALQSNGLLEESDSTSSSRRFLLLPFPLVSSAFRKGVIHRPVIRLFLLGDIKYHRLLRALLTAIENFQNPPPFTSSPPQACNCSSSIDSPTPYCPAGQKGGPGSASDWPLGCPRAPGRVSQDLPRQLHHLARLAFSSFLISIHMSQNYGQGQRAFSQGSLQFFEEES